MLSQWLYSEGDTPSDRWKWNETIGAVIDRPGRQGIVINSTIVEKDTHLVWSLGDWGYPNTDALGESSIFLELYTTLTFV